jgi:hypothetical protein
MTPLRLPPPGAATGLARGPDQSEEAAPALQGGAANRTQGRWRKRALGTRARKIRTCAGRSTFGGRQKECVSRFL